MIFAVVRFWISPLFQFWTLCSCWEAWRGLFAFALLDVLNGNPKLLYSKLRILAHFLAPAWHANAQLTPYVLMAGKPVEAMERLPVEGKSGHVENEHGSPNRLRRQPVRSSDALEPNQVDEQAGRSSQSAKLAALRGASRGSCRPVVGETIFEICWRWIV